MTDAAYKKERKIQIDQLFSDDESHPSEERMKLNSRPLIHSDDSSSVEDGIDEWNILRRSRTVATQVGSVYRCAAI